MALNQPAGGASLQHVACAVCGADNARTRWETALPGASESDLSSFFRCTNAHYGQFGRIVQCRECGLLYRDPQELNISELYAGVKDEAYHHEAPARHCTFRRTLAQIHRLVWPPAQLLDVGCSTGLFLEVARSAGWQVAGLDPCEWAVEEGRNKGLSIRLGTLTDGVLPPEQFDLITLWDVIEHVPGPRETLSAVWDILRPGGLVALTTMDVTSVVARIFGRRWPHLMRMHLWYFSFDHLVTLLQQAGFERPVRRPHGGCPRRS